MPSAPAAVQEMSTVGEELDPEAKLAVRINTSLVFHEMSYNSNLGFRVFNATA